MIENHVAFPADLRAGLVGMVAHAQTVQRDLKNVTKILEELAKKDKTCQLIQTVPGLGTICSCRLRATAGTSQGSKILKIFLPITA